MDIQCLKFAKDLNFAFHKDCFNMIKKFQLTSKRSFLNLYIDRVTKSHLTKRWSRCLKKIMQEYFENGCLCIIGLCDFLII